MNYGYRGPYMRDQEERRFYRKLQIWCAIVSAFVVTGTIILAACS